MNFLIEFLVIYIEDLIVYSKDKRDYKMYIKIIVQYLTEMIIQANNKKCKFHVTETNFLKMSDCQFR